MAKHEKRVALKRVYEPAEAEDRTRVLVDRVWPVLGTSDICLYTRCLRAPANRRKCCPIGLHLDSDGGVKRHASRSGTLRGVRPEDLVPISGTDRGDGANSAIYADARNLCWKRRDDKEVKAVHYLTGNRLILFKPFLRTFMVKQHRGTSP